MALFIVRSIENFKKYFDLQPYAGFGGLILKNAVGNQRFRTKGKDLMGFKIIYLLVNNTNLHYLILETLLVLKMFGCL